MKEKAYLQQQLAGAISSFTDQQTRWMARMAELTAQQSPATADDLTDPAPATTFAHLDAQTVLSRDIASLGIYPAVDPLDSSSRMMDPRIVGDEHYSVARSVQKLLQDYKSLQDIIAILGMDELSEDDKLTVESRKDHSVDGGGEVLLHQGIAERNFKRVWTLSPTIVVDSASFVNGLLTINLKNEVPEKEKPRKIPFS